MEGILSFSAESWGDSSAPSRPRQQQHLQQENRRTPQPQEGNKRKLEKLRDSCDNCGLCKVKCSKEQPSCARCKDRDLYCHYSPTQRTGKPPVRSSQACQQTSSSLSTSSAPPRGISPADELPSYFDDSTLFLTTDDNAMFSYDHSSTGGTTTPLVSPPLPQLPGMFQGNLDPNMFHTEQHPPQTTTATTASMLDQIGTSLMGRSDFDRTPDELVSIFDGGSAYIETVSRAVTQSHSDRSSNGPDSDPGRGQAQHYCLAEALELLQKFHTAPAQCTLLTMTSASPFSGLSSGSSPSAASSSSPIVRTVDQILATNMETLDGVNHILDCSCSLNTQLALILSTIVFQVICWYSAAAQESPPTGSSSSSNGTEGSPPSAALFSSGGPGTVGEEGGDTPMVDGGGDDHDSSGSSSTSSISNHHRHLNAAPPSPAAAPLRPRPPRRENSASFLGADHVVIGDAPITVGRYSLEGASKAKMRAQLVMSELHLVLGTVGKLVGRFRAIGEAEAFGGGGPSAVILAGMEKFLRDRLLVLTREIVGRIEVDLMDLGRDV